MKVICFAILAAAAAAASATATASAPAYSLRGSDGDKHQMKRDLKVNGISVNVELPEKANDNVIPPALEFDAGGDKDNSPSVPAVAVVASGGAAGGGGGGGGGSCAGMGESCSSTSDCCSGICGGSGTCVAAV